METINIQLQVPNTEPYNLDEFIAKIKDYADKLANTFPVKNYRDTPSLSKRARIVCSRKP